MTTTQLLSDYSTAINVIALIALMVLAGAAFFRRESVWLWLLGLVVFIWAGSQVLRLI